MESGCLFLMSETNGHDAPVGPLMLSEPPAANAPTKMDYSELGASGGTRYGQYIIDDYNPKLQGQRGIDTYDKMRKGDGQVRGTLRLVKSPLLSAQWYIEPYSQAQIDLDVAEALTWALFEGMSRTWIQVLQEAMLMLDFGYYAFEKVWKTVTWTPSRDGANKRLLNTWKKWAPRHPRTNIGWIWDDNGGIQGMRHLKVSNNVTEQVEIDIDKLLIFTHDEESNDPQGVSILRSAYPHWYFKNGFYKVDGIQKERHAIGVPHIKLPENANPQDITLAQQMGKNLRTNEKSFVVTPPGWEVSFIKLDSAPVDVLKSIDHHNHQISNNVLASFLDLGSSSSGSRAVGDVQSDIFMKALRYLGDVVRGVVNSYAIPEFVNYNWKDVKGYPKLRVRRIGENVDNRALAVAMANYVRYGILTADPELEAFIRDINDLPNMSEDAAARGVDERVAVKQIAPAGSQDAPVDPNVGPDPVITPPPSGGGAGSGSGN